MHHHDAQHAAMGLASLDEMNDFKVAEGFPDPRGWDVKTADGRTIGKVKDLLVDKQAMRVKLLEVELRDEFASGRDDVRVHVPVASARLDDDHDDVIVDLATAGLGDFSSTAGTVDTLGTVGTATTRDASATTGLGAAAAGTAAMGAGRLADDDLDDDRRFFGNRIRGRENEQFLRLHEEQLSVGKRQVQSGQVELHKTVDTEQVRETVPVMHEEVSVERHPISADAARDANLTIGEESIRVPLTAEEVVVDKRVVPVEEVIVRKEAHTEQHVVEDTVRRERVDVDRDVNALDRDGVDRTRDRDSRI
ncbi:MAG TPA: DUF2382 domain-containing protein [Gemmatirosa sp.]|nr:DUF2382 domain-containing protein [Gemmatirosa sp.]